MFRICLCLSITLLVAIAAPALARETRHSSPNGSGCSEASIAAEEKAGTPPRTTPAAKTGSESRSQPTVHGDAPASGRLSPRRWHSFLPGMVR